MLAADEQAAEPPLVALCRRELRERARAYTRKEQCDAVWKQQRGVRIRFAAYGLRIIPAKQSPAAPDAAMDFVAERNPALDQAVPM